MAIGVVVRACAEFRKLTGNLNSSRYETARYLRADELVNGCGGWKLPA